MELLEIITSYKIPYNFLATKMGMKLGTFKVKMRNDIRKFTPEEMTRLMYAVDTYCLEIRKALPEAA